MEIIWLMTAGTIGMSYAWGMRGTLIGHGQGAMVPGAMLGFFMAAMASLLGMSAAWENVWLLCGVGAAAMYFGGDMTYGQTIGLALDGTKTGFRRGMGGLFLRGAIWFGVAGGWLAIAFAAFYRGVYTAWELPAAVAAAAALRAAGVRLLNRPHAPEQGRLPRFYFSKNRPECWGGYLLVWVGLALWMLCRGDMRSLVISALAALGGGLGWFFGNSMQLWSKRPFRSGRLFLGALNRAGMVNGWKIMECSIGALGGFGALFGFWLAYRKVPAAAASFEPLLAPFSSAAVAAAAVWLALLLAYSALSIRAAALPPYRPELERLRTLGLISEESYEKKRVSATDERPSGLLGAVAKYGGAGDRLVYAVLPLLLSLSGSALAAQLEAVFVVVWVLMERMLFGRFEDFKGLAAIRAFFLLLSAAVLAGQLLCYPAGWPPVWMMAVYTAFYTAVMLINDYRPKNFQQMRAAQTGFVKAFGTNITKGLYFILCSAAVMLWCVLAL